MKSSYLKFLIPFLCAVQFAHILDFVVIMPLGPILIQDLKIQANEFSFLVSAYTFSAAIFGMILSFWMDRLRRKKVLQWILLFFSLSTFACGMSSSYFLIVFSRVIAGASGGVLSGLILAILADEVSPERRGQATGAVMSSFSLSAIFGIPASLWITEKFHWSYVFFGIAFLGLILIFLSEKIIPLREPKVRQSYQKAESIMPFLNPICVTFFSVLAVYCVVPYISSSLVMNLKMTQSQLPKLYFIAGLVTFFFARFIGKISDLLNKKSIYLFLVLSSLPVVYWITNLKTQNFILSTIVVTLFMSLHSTRTIPLLTLISISTPVSLRGRLMSLNSVAQQFASSFGAMIVGFFVHVNSQNHLVGFENSGFISILSSILAAFLCWRFFK